MNRLICLCSGIRENKIKQAITNDNASSLELVQLHTGAACNCGRCIPLIDEIIAESMVLKKAASKNETA